jgi:hypothetical protein
MLAFEAKRELFQHVVAIAAAVDELIINKLLCSNQSGLWQLLVAF